MHESWMNMSREEGSMICEGASVCWRGFSTAAVIAVFAAIAAFMLFMGLAVFTVPSAWGMQAASSAEKPATKVAASTSAAGTAGAATSGDSASSAGDATASTYADAATTADAATSATAATSANSANATTPFAAHGALRVDGAKVVDEHGDTFQIRGISTHGIAWFPQYVNEDAFATWESWGANTIRLALYTAESGGYCTSDAATQDGLLATLYQGVDAATDLGMYVIVDWHILSDGDPATNQTQAEVFFSAISAKYADHANVLYEICNEPNGSATWDGIKAYAEDIIPIIRANAPDAIVIVGTPTWSQDVDKVAADPLSASDIAGSAASASAAGSSASTSAAAGSAAAGSAATASSAAAANVVYTLHFYAATHKDDLRAKAQSAIDAGLPLLVSEFGACEASGNGVVDTASADAWIALLDKAGVGFVCWNLSNKDEASSLLLPSCTTTSGWTEADLSAEGQWYRTVLLTHAGLAGGASTASTSVGSIGTSAASGSAFADTTGTPAASSTTTSVSSDKAGNGLIATCTKTGGWESGGKQYVQYALSVTNAGGAAVAGWKATVSFVGAVELSDGWCASFDASGTQLAIVPADYAAGIAAGASQTSIGFIVCSSDEPKLDGITVG